MRVKCDAIIRGIMDMKPMTINDKMFRSIFVENVNPMIKDKMRSRMSKDLMHVEQRVRNLYEPSNFFSQMTDIFEEYSAKYKKRNTSSSKSISCTRTKNISVPSTRNIVPSQHRQTRGNTVIPTPV